jgi:hypothetical protein
MLTGSYGVWYLYIKVKKKASNTHPQREKYNNNQRIESIYIRKKGLVPAINKTGVVRAAAEEDEYWAESFNIFGLRTDSARRSHQVMRLLLPTAAGPFIRRRLFVSCCSDGDRPDGVGRIDPASQTRRPFECGCLLVYNTLTYPHHARG